MQDRIKGRTKPRGGGQERITGRKGSQAGLDLRKDRVSGRSEYQAGQDNRQRET
jgi:hypothetical protein